MRNNTVISKNKEQNMENVDTSENIKALLLKCFDFVLSSLCAFGIVAIIELHFFVPFFPVLFLLDLCLMFGYPLFLHYVLKREWGECTKDDYLALKYILIPWLVMELIVMIYYHNEIMLIQ